MPNLLVWAVGSRNPSITENITVDGVPFDLSASTVRFKMRAVGSTTLKVDAAATIVAPATGGNVRYDWAALDVDTAATYLVWWEVTTASKVQDVGEAIIEFRAHAPLVGYVELEELKKTLGLDSTTFADLDVTGAILSASRTIDDITGRRFYTTTSNEVRYFNADHWTTHYRYVDGDVVGSVSSAELDVGDLNALTEIAVDTNDDGTFDQTWVLDTDFRLEPYNATLDGVPWDRIVLRPAAGRSFPSYDHSIRVTGKFGWTPVPAAVKTATVMYAGRLLKRMREAPFGVAGIGPDGDAVRISSVDPDIEALLRPYVRHSVLT